MLLSSSSSSSSLFLFLLACSTIGTSVVAAAAAWVAPAITTSRTKTTAKRTSTNNFLFGRSRSRRSRNSRRSFHCDYFSSSSLLLPPLHAFSSPLGGGGGGGQNYNAYMRTPLRRNVTLPLMDVGLEGSTSDYKDKIVTPLPASHLPDELSTCNMYGMELDRPVHKMLMQDAMERRLQQQGGVAAAADSKRKSDMFTSLTGTFMPSLGLYGHLVVSPTTTTATPRDNEPSQQQQQQEEAPQKSDDKDDSEPIFYEEEDWPFAFDDDDNQVQGDGSTSVSDGGFTSPSSLVGAIGCAAEILIHAPSTAQSTGKGGATSNKNDGNRESENAPVTILCQGSFRFQVKEIIQTIPFPVAIVDEIADDEPLSGSESSSSDNENNDKDEEDDDDARYENMDSSQLVQGIMRGINDYLELQLKLTRDENSQKPTLLEQSILESMTDAGSAHKIAGANAQLQIQQLEEASAVWSVFESSLVDLFQSRREIHAAIGFLAAEILNADNEIRRKVLETTKGLERLRIILKLLDAKLGMTRATLTASELLADKKEKDSPDQDLKVGAPQLPPWAGQIKKGQKVEYFWNEEYGWCSGVVVETPRRVANELLITVRFDSDGESHRLPFSGEDKLRWRPGK